MHAKLHPSSRRRQTAADKAAQRAGHASPGHFTNPIVAAAVPAGSADPSVVHVNGHYYYCRSVGDRFLGVARAERLQDIGRAEMVNVFEPEVGTPWSCEIWAPELQFVRGRWYIYFAASDGDNRNHRMYALEAVTDDPQGEYVFRGQLTDATNRWAIDGIAVESEGGLYFVWSGWRNEDDGFPQVLYIAEMSDPCTIVGERHEIAAPDLPWECQGASLLEGPAVLYGDSGLFITYSASASWTDHYAVGLLHYQGGDILSAAAWHKSPTPVFAARPEQRVFGPGHNSFVKSPDGTEDWIVYHAIDSSGGGWSQRSVRAQRFDWTADGIPMLGMPVGHGVRVEEPSGTRTMASAGTHETAAVVALPPEAAAA
ncbi:family 43 glycosylhydrolase [Roseateles cellulosilyticus]|uniref:Glycoside hydrolase family 43 protein n=1 Tax=Pelomonas cellulosilytica TaxID=2906762 RepID=A0ABS8Y0T9_9BURK|nr:glycoside hydrolase family 43 protein [Pelomonas sp. P8]MCE4556677.1 glycoside hydrolase family 43 protein [Pelomonas sp. P8]